MDLFELYPLWSWYSPLVLHLVAYALQQVLSAAIGLAVHISGTCLGSWGRVISWSLMVASAVLLMFCSSASLLLALMAVLIRASYDTMVEPV